MRTKKKAALEWQMPHLTWRHRSVWPSWPRSCSRCSGETPSSGSRGPTAKESTSCGEQGETLPCARDQNATENSAWDRDRPVERGRIGPQGMVSEAKLPLGLGLGQDSTARGSTTWTTREGTDGGGQLRDSRLPQHGKHHSTWDQTVANQLP